MRVFIVLGVILFSVGCAQSPVYETKIEYIKPESQSGQACTENCKQAFESCYHLAPKLAIKKHEEERNKYEKDIEVYNSEVKAFEYNKRKFIRENNKLRDAWMHYDMLCRENESILNKNCDIRKEIERRRDILQLRYTSFQKEHEPVLPAKPHSVESWTNAIRKKVCKLEFSDCFKGCGGKIVTHNICIKNCE